MNTAYYIWEMWYNQVMVSKGTTLLGQTGITLLALAIICFLVYKLTKATGGRHPTPLQNKERHKPTPVWYTCTMRFSSGKNHEVAIRVTECRR